MTKSQPTVNRVDCILAPAKINIGLSIVGRRPDEYHLLESLFWPLRFEDEIQIEPTNRNEVRAEWIADAPFTAEVLPQGSSNLVQRALDLALPADRALSIKIGKRIPMGGGLGGGSSDAGAMLKYLIRNQMVSVEDAEKIALKLGADVPFFLDARPSWVTGIGERRQPLNIDSSLREALTFILVLLPRPTITAEVFALYRAMALPFSPPQDRNWNRPLDQASLSQYLKEAVNDLEPAACRLYPLIGEVLYVLRQNACRYAGLSGTGSTCYAICESPKAAEHSAKDFHHFLRKRNCKSVVAATHFDA